MKPHPPPHIIRKTIKWGGAAVTVLLVVVWIGSVCFEGSNSLRALGRDWSIAHGQLHTMSAGGRINVIPIWFLMIVVALPTAVAWHPDFRARRRAKLNLCPGVQLRPHRPCDEGCEVSGVRGGCFCKRRRVNS